MTPTDDLRALAAQITPGPWMQGEDFPYDIHAADGDVEPAIGCVFTDGTSEEQWRANARAIAMVPDLLAEVIALRERVAVLERALRSIILETGGTAIPNESLRACRTRASAALST